MGRLSQDVRTDEVVSAITEVTGGVGLTCSTPQFFAGDKRRIWNMYYTISDSEINK